MEGTDTESTENDEEEEKTPNHRRRRRHTISGLQIQTEVIRGRYLYLMFKNLMYPIHVFTEYDDIYYDIVQTLPRLLFIYKLNKHLNPINVDGRIKQEFELNILFNNQYLIYIENPLYKFYLTKEFYIKHILQILDYFFDSKWYNKIDKYNINNSSISTILNWKYYVYLNKIKFCPEIYQYFNNTKKLCININRLKSCNEAMNCLLHKKCKNLLLFNVIGQLFTKCEEIICYEVKTINLYYIQQFLLIIKNLNQFKNIKLKNIVLYNDIKILCHNDEFDKFKQKFVRNNWKITKKFKNQNDKQHQYVTIDKIVLR